LGTSPYRAAFGRTPNGPLQILCDSWAGKRELPLNLAKHSREYLQEVKEKLRIGQEYAEKHAVKAQKRYADYYNSKLSNKQFDVGEQVIYLARNSNQKMFSHWLGPCLILRKKSSHSYVIDVDGVHRTVHVNHLRKFHPSISEVNVNNCAMIFDSDEDLSHLNSTQRQLAVDYKYVNSVTQNDAYVMPNLNDLIHKVASLRQRRSGYWQLPVKPEDRWLTAFAYDGGLWEWTRLPFGLCTCGNSFVRCVQIILNPVRKFSF